MPVLKLPQPEGYSDFTYVFATMLFPDDLDVRNDSIEFLRAELFVPECREGMGELLGRPPNPIELRLLESAEIFQRHSVGPDYRNRFNHGLTEGALLSVALREKSVSAAIRSIDSTGLRGIRKENIRQHIWPTYRSVAHFWMALRGRGFRGWDHGMPEVERLIALAQKDPAGTVDIYEPRLKACQTKMDEFLALSEILLLIGTRTKPDRGKESILNYKKSWRLPDRHPARELMPTIAKNLTM
jgi:hypothetical protein